MKKLVFLLIPVFMLSLAVCSFSGCGQPKTNVPESVEPGPKPDKEPEVGTMEIQKLK